ncbi:MAG: hypothetical protein J7555_10395 [Chloroflexi bacterium]|nr:hypothetical protein [Chloroflexota bacterium]
MPVRKLAFARYALLPLVLLIVAAGVFAMRHVSAPVWQSPEALPTAPPTPTPQK